MVLLALLLACAIALPLGVLAATRPGSWIDQLCRLVTTAGVSLPTFFTGLLLAYVFYFLLGWAPSPLGRLDPMFSPPPHGQRPVPDRRGAGRRRLRCGGRASSS